MGQLAFVFPGQGSQYPGMGAALYQGSKAAKQVLDQAERLMPGLLDLCFAGPADKLTQTKYAQPALFAVSLAATAAAQEAGLTADAVAGFSLGEWTAVQTAGMLPFDEAFALVMKRGQWMQECAQKNPGGMAAVLRTSADELARILDSFPQVYPVNYNTQQQIVVAGAHEQLDGFLQHMKDSGKRCMKLNVSGAFHSPLMQNASELLLEALRGTNLQCPRIPVYSNVTAKPYELSQAKDILARQASTKVLWADSVRNMVQDGITTFVELGPGRVLSGLIAKIAPDATVYQAEDLDGIQKAVQAIGENT